MHFYDIVLTFDREMESIWLKPKYSWMTLLWALVRRRPHSFAVSPPLLSKQGDLELTKVVERQDDLARRRRPRSPVDGAGDGEHRQSEEKEVNERLAQPALRDRHA